MSFDLDTLVFDRTLQDVESGTAKGYYNADDVNRVSRACNYMIDMFASYGYIVPDTLGTNRLHSYIPRVSEMQKYYDTIATLCGMIRYADNPPVLPGTMDRLTHIGANAIEENLQLLGKIAEKIPQTWFSCGQIESGVAYR